MHIAAKCAPAANGPAMMGFVLVGSILFACGRTMPHQPGQDAAGPSATEDGGCTGPGGIRVKAVATGGSYTCLLTIEGGMRCWGNSFFGQLGDGTTIGRTIPTESGRARWRRLSRAHRRQHLRTDGERRCPVLGRQPVRDAW